MVGAGYRVADVGAGDQGSDAAQRLLVGEQFLEEFPKRFGGWVVSAPQCHLGLGVQQRACAGEVALVVIRVQQAGRRPAVDGGGQLPGQVDRVEHADVEADARGGELMGRIAGQQDPPIAIPLGLPGVKREARQPGRFSQGQIHAEHATDAVLELGQGHRRVIVVLGGLVLGRLKQQTPEVSRPKANTPRSVRVKPGRIRPSPGTSMSPLSSRVTESGTVTWPSRLTSGYVVPGNGIPAAVADPAVRAVAAHQVLGGHPVRPVRAAHVRGHRGVVLAHPDHLVSAAYVGAEFAGEVAEQALESRLRERHRPYRGIRQV